MEFKYGRTLNGDLTKGILIQIELIHTNGIMRYREYGETSAEHLRDKLIEVINMTSHYVITLDFKEPYLTSSYLEEVFGGLIREGYTTNFLFDKIAIYGMMPSYIDKIVKFMNEAETLMDRNVKYRLETWYLKHRVK